MRAGGGTDCGKFGRAAGNVRVKIAPAQKSLQLPASSPPSQFSSTAAVTFQNPNH